MENAFENLSGSSFSQQPVKTPGKSSKRFLFVIIFLIIIALFSFGGYRFLGAKEEVKKEPEPTSIPTEFFLPTETPTPTEEVKNSPTPAKKTQVPTPTPTKTPPKSTLGSKTDGIDRSSLSIEVLNGGGVVGAASKLTEVLKGLGYNVVSMGNADNFDYQETLIGIKEEKKSFLPTLKKDLSETYILGQGSASPSAAADAVIIIGKE